jgi:hypothetical protein
MKYDTNDIAAFIVEMTERTPELDRTMRMFDAAVGHKFPGVDIDQLYAAYHIATATLKAAGR